MEHLGRKIKKLRELRNISQRHMAEKLGISQPTYSLLEKEEEFIHEERLQKIADILEVSVADIHSFDDRAILNIIQHNTIENQGFAYVHNNNKYSDDRVIELLESKIKLYEANNGLLDAMVQSLTEKIKKLEEENNSLRKK